MNVIFLRRGLETLPEDQPRERAGGVILTYTIDDLEGELTRLEAADAEITMPLTAGERGERAVQVRDTSGVVVQLLDWNAPAGE